MPHPTSFVVVLVVVLCSILFTCAHLLPHDTSKPQNAPPPTAPPQSGDFDLSQAIHIATVLAQPLPQQLIGAEGNNRRSDEGLGAEQHGEEAPTTKFWLQFRVDEINSTTPPPAPPTPHTNTTLVADDPSPPPSHLPLVLDIVLEPNDHFLSSHYEEVIHIKQPRRSLNATDPTEPGPMTKIEVPEDNKYLPTLRRVKSCVYNGYLFNPATLAPIENSMASITTCSGSIKGWVRTPAGQYYSVENNAQLQEKYSKRYQDPAIKALFRQYKRMAQAGDIEGLIRLNPTVHLVDANRESAHEAEKDGNGDVLKQHQH